MYNVLPTSMTFKKIPLLIKHCCIPFWKTFVSRYPVGIIMKLSQHWMGSHITVVKQPPDNNNHSPVSGILLKLFWIRSAHPQKLSRNSHISVRAHVHLRSPSIRVWIPVRAPHRVVFTVYTASEARIRGHQNPTNTHVRSPFDLSIVLTIPLFYYSKPILKFPWRCQTNVNNHDQGYQYSISSKVIWVQLIRKYHFMELL